MSGFTIAMVIYWVPVIILFGRLCWIGPRDRRNDFKPLTWEYALGEIGLDDRWYNRLATVSLASLMWPVLKALALLDTMRRT